MKQALTLLLVLCSAAVTAPDVPPAVDPPPTLKIDDVVVAEGKQGVTQAKFKVTLSGARELPVSVDWATQDLTASAGSDYRAAACRLQFDAAGELEIEVDVFGDVDPTEGSEVFFVRLSSPANAVIADALGHGVIRDDDYVSPQAKCDLEPDGRSNLLVFHEHLDGHNPLHQDWGMVGTIATTGPKTVEFPTGTNPAWVLRAMDDFDGNRTCDLFWELGNAVALTLTGPHGSLLAPLNQDILPIPHPGTGWRLVGSGPFDGDGRADVLWWNASLRTLRVWFWSSGVLIPHDLRDMHSDVAAEPVAVVDLDGDETFGILWRNPGTGELTHWRMNGFFVLEQTLLEVGADREIDPSWSLVAVGDFNGDGTDDLLWQDHSARTAVWFMRDTRLLAESLLSSERLEIPEQTPGIVLGPR